MNQEKSPESRPKNELRVRAEAIANQAREFFGFQAPLQLEVIDRPEGSPPTARLRRRSPKPYESSGQPIEVVIYQPADETGRERLGQMLEFMLRHEVAHNVPLPSDKELRALPGPELKRFETGTHLKPETIFTGRDEVITDVLALRSLRQADGSMTDEAWTSYRSLLTRMAEPHGPTTARFRDLLRGLVETESLATDETVPEEQRTWLSAWAQQALEHLQELPSNDQALLGRARDYFARSYRAAWKLPLGQ